MRDEKETCVVSVEKEAPHTHSDYLRYGSTFFFLFFFLPKQNSRFKAFAKEDGSGMPEVTPPKYLTNFFALLSSIPPTHPGAGHDLASTLLHIKLFLGYIE